MEAKIAQPHGSSLTTEAVEFLALNLESVTNAAIPAEHGMKDIIEVAQFQAVRHSHQPDHHWVNVTKYRTQNQPFEGCCCTHPLSLRLIPDFVLHSRQRQSKRSVAKNILAHVQQFSKKRTSLDYDDSSMYYHAKVGQTRPDGLTEVQIEFGEPAGNDVVVPAAIEALRQLDLKGGKGILFNGRASLPVAMAAAHAVAHLYQFVACFDPKINRYVVAISHTPDHRPGDLI